MGTRRSDKRRLVPLDAVVKALRDGRRFLITSHPSPDGDAIGCMAAMQLVLEQLGKSVVAYNPDRVPNRYRFLRGVDRFTTEFPTDSLDTALVLDCSDSRVLRSEQLLSRIWERVVVVDHHEPSGDFGDVVLRDPNAASVGIMLYRIFGRLGVRLSVEVAEALYCSVMSDTGSFRYQNTNGEALRVAAELLEHGINPWHVSSHLYEERPRRELELLALVLQTLVVAPDGHSASLTVTEQMLAETGCTPDVVDGYINYARGLEGVEVAILLRPRGGKVRVSLRSRGTIDVAKLAERHGGGGHHNAAGCLVTEATAQIRDTLFAEVGELLRMLP